MYTLDLLGGASLRGPDGPVRGPVAQRHRIALLAVLARPPSGPVSRDKLLAMLWPESPPAQARHALSQALYVIRRELGEDVVHGSAGDLVLNPALLTTDVHAFEARLAAGDPEQAVSLYAGPFLDGFHAHAGVEFEAWAHLQREALAADYAGALETLAEGAAARGDAVEALTRWKQRAAADPFDSRVAMRLMLAYAEAGNHAAAVQHAEIHAVLLREELEVEPDPAVMELAEELRAGGGQSRLERPSRSEAGEGPAGESPAVEARLQIRTVGEPTSATTAARPGPRADRRIRRRVAAALALAAVAGLMWLTVDRPPPPAAQSGPFEAPVPSVAVLPCENMSPDPADAYLASGLHEEILFRLHGIPGLRSVGRQPVAWYGRNPGPPTDVSSRLGVAFIGECSVRTDAAVDRVRITFQLLSGDSGTQLWAESYDRTLNAGELFEVQGAIAQHIAESVGATVTPERRVGMARVPTRDLEAYSLYLAASDQDRAGSASGYEEQNRRWRRAIELYGDAVSVDPGFARAYAAMAMAHLRLFWRGHDRTPERLALAKPALDRALALRPDLAGGHLAMGFYHYWGFRRYETALASFDTAIHLAPGDGRAHLARGAVLRRLGRFQDALESQVRGVTFDPGTGDLDVAGAFGNIGHTLGAMRRFEEALTWYRRAESAQPGNPRPYTGAAVAHFKLGRLDSARAALARSPAQDERRVVDVGFWVEASARDWDAAEAWLERGAELERRGAWGNRPVELYRGHLFTWSGRPAEAEAAYRRSLQVRPTAEALAQLGDREGALALVEARLRRNAEEPDLYSRPVPSPSMAWVYAWLGEADAAVDLLETLMGMQYLFALTPAELRLDPTYDGIRHHPRFQELLARYGGDPSDG